MGRGRGSKHFIFCPPGQPPGRLCEEHPSPTPGGEEEARPTQGGVAGGVAVSSRHEEPSVEVPSAEGGSSIHTPLLGSEHPEARLGLGSEHPEARLGLGSEHPEVRLGLGSEHPEATAASPAALLGELVREEGAEEEGAGEEGREGESFEELFSRFADMKSV